MLRFLGELDVDLPPKAAYGRLADMAQLDRWNPNVDDSERIGGEHLAVGSTYRSTVVNGPVRMTARSELMRVEPGRFVEYEGSIGPFWSVDSLSFEPHDGGTRVTFRNETTVPIWLRWATRIMQAVFQRQAQRAVDGAARHLRQPPH